MLNGEAVNPAVFSIASMFFCLVRMGWDLVVPSVAFVKLVRRGFPLLCWVMSVYRLGHSHLSTDVSS